MSTSKTDYYQVMRFKTRQGDEYLGVGYVWVNEDGAESFSTRPVTLMMPGNRIEDAVGEAEKMLADIKAHPIRDLGK